MMQYKFKLTSSKDFNNTLKEITVLKNFALSENNSGNFENRSMFLKLCVVATVTKLQVFIEKILDEYKEKLKKKKIKYAKIPLHFRINSIKLNSIRYSISDKLENSGNFTLPKLIELNIELNKLLKHCEDNNIVSDEIDMKTKFPLGKTGKNEIIDLFKQFTGKDIFAENNFDINPVDSLLNMRHNIIHQDACPPLTESLIDQYLQFVKNLSEFIDKNLFLFLR